ncbi:MAG TPA: tandem-95 repeat protein, partial [Pyrinomonadaceae bacterium]|nr:tandem-95 repeat protein [Pyrinomonadaceae bacterium]
ATANSGSLEGSAISIVTTETGSHTVTITGNTLRQYNNNGIILQAGGSGIAGNGQLKATIQSNTISNPGNIGLPAGINGIHLNSGTSPGDSYSVCLTIGGAGALQNNMAGSGAQTQGSTTGEDFRFRNRQSTTDYLTAYAGANNDDAAVAAYLKARNSGNGVPTATGGTTVTNNTPTSGGWSGAACPATPAGMLNQDSFHRDELAQTTAQPQTETQASAKSEARESAAPSSGVFSSHGGSKRSVKHTAQPSALEVPGLQLMKSADKRIAVDAYAKHAVGEVFAGDYGVKAHAASVMSAPLAPVGPNVSVTIGTLPDTKSVKIKFQVTINNPLSPTTTAQVQTQGTVTSSAGSVQTDDPDTVASPPPPDATVTLIAHTDLTMQSKTDGVATITPGSVLTYTLSYKNSGRSATGVVLTETVPAGTTSDASNAAAGWVCAPDGNAGSTCTFSVGSLAFNAAVGTKTFKVVVNNPAAAGLNTISNTASIADDGAYEVDVNPADNSKTDSDTALNAVPDLNVTSKSDGVANTTPNSTLTYTINYSNSGNQGAANVVLTETVPTGTTYVAAGSSAWSCSDGAVGGTPCTISVGSLSGGGASGNATFVVHVNTPAAAGLNNIANTASIDDDHANGADPTPASNSKTDTDILDAAPDLSVTKTPDVANASANTLITYTLNYSNTGNQGAAGVVLTETVPANTTLNAAGSTVGWVCAPNNNAGSTCTLAVGSLAAGGNGSAAFAVTVNSPVPGGTTQISNTATIADNGANGADTNPANNTTGAVTTPVCQSAITVTNTNDSGAGSLRQAILDACPGATITFNIAGAGPHTVSITSGPLAISKNLTITGPLDKSITINGNGTGRVFNITGGTVAISNLTVSGAGGNASGGGLMAQGATTNVTLTGMLFTGNTVISSGGAMGVISGATLNVRNTTVSGNTATNGGGLYNSGGTLNLLNVTVTNNNANGDIGGGPGGVQGEGGAIDTGSSTTNVTNSILTGNTAINTSLLNISGTLTTSSNNLVAGDPRIGALASNGGPTRTHALLIDSPALDAGDNASATAAGLTLDQRGTGFKRILDAADADETDTVDIGAYEANPMIQDIADQVTNEDVSITCLPFNVGDNDEGFSSITATSSVPGVVPNANLAVSAGPGPGSSNRCLAITLPANQSGVTTITVTVTGNNTRTISDSFQLTVNSVNDTPTTLGIPAVNVNEDAADTLINLPARFGDVEDGAAALGYSVQGNTNPGLFTSVTIGAGNVLTLDYAPNTSGTSDITIRATDSGGFFVETTFTVTVTAINDAPTLDALSNATIAEDATTQTVNLSGIGAGPNESQTLVVTAASSNTTIIPNPSVTYTSPNATGSISYAPVANANGGPVTITVTVTDNGGTAGGGVDSFQRTFTVTVTEVNDAPVATDDTPSDILEDSAPTAFSFASLLANDSKGPANENGQTLNITGVSNFVGGTAQIVGTDVVFTPTPNYSGPASFEYTVTDNGTTNTVADPKTDIGKASFNVTAVNDEPSFTKGADQSVNEDAAAQTVNGWATAISAGPNESGQVVDFVVTNNNNALFSVQPAVSSTGVLTYTLAADANGAATVSVKIHDNGGTLNGGDDESPVQTFTITVAAINDAPIFQIPSNPPAVNEDAPAQTVNSFVTNFKPGPVTATDETGQTVVSYTVTQTGTTGNVTFTSGPSISNAGTLTYTPTSNTSGTATFNVVATDSGSGTSPNVNQSAPVAFTIQVTGQNDAPVLDNSGNMTLTAINEDVPNASNPGTLVSDIILSAGGDRITDVDAGAIEGIAVTAVSNANGAWQYSIDNGTNWLPFNTPDATTARLLAANATTRVRFIPNANFNGTVNPGLTFRAWDQTSGTNGSTADVSVLFGGTTAFSIATETATITVGAVNDTPTANAQVVGTNEDTPVGITLTGTDVETASGAMTYNVTVLPLHGTLTGTGANRTYTPNPDYNGPDSFQFTVTDTGDGSSPALTSAAATVTINVGAINDAPVANAQSVSTNEDTAKSITLTGTDIDTPQGSLSFIIVTGPAHGTIDPGASPNRTYTPTGNYNGPDSFTFKINDGSADSNTATVTITVNPVNDTPTADAQAVSTNEDTPKAITLTGSDTETAQANLVFNVTVQPTHGVLSGTGANRTYTPTGDYNGPDSFKFTVTDTGDGSSPALTSAEATVSITVNAVNDAPVNTVPGAQSVVKNGALPFSAANSNLIAIADVDAGAGPVKVTLTATNGSITLSGIAGLSFTVGDGTSDPTMTFTGAITNINAALSGMTFSPTNGYDGPATLQITTNDQGNTGSGGAQSDTDTINIDVLKGGVLQFSAATYTVSEGGGTVTITVTRTDGSVGTSHVDYATSNGTATAGQDYTAASGQLTFDPGVTTQTFNVPITNDTIDENDETVNLTLSNVTGSSSLGAQTTAVLTITDNDPTPTLSITDATVTEGNSGTVNATFTVSLSAASGLPVSVNYQTADGTATAPSDYTAIPSTALNFAPGETTKTVTVLVKGDTLAEADENFFVNLSGAVNASIADNQGQGNIVSDDTPLIEFSSSTYSVQEDGLRVFVRVNRKGDLSKVANVDYATSDPSGLNNCDQVTGIASSRCDYATTVGTLRFAAGESFKDIAIPIVNDVYAEGGNGEVFTITLSNVSGADLGSPTTATITINDLTDNGTEPNPIDNDSFFIRQLYIDFLGREPEPGAINNWLGILNHCAIPTDCDRNAVAQGFVRSTEFQERGYFVYRFYTASLGRIPLYSEFIPDTAKVSGFLSTSDLEANKVAYIAEFMNRPEFKNLYDVTLNNPAAYVDKLLATAVLPNHPRRAEWINGLTNNTLTRAQVLRQFVESTEVFTKYVNEAFIVMNYFGFLRRNPDAAFQAWIQIFNKSNDDKGIINGFVNSAEYRHRFGQ